jgi:hypothetical protein
LARGQLLCSTEIEEVLMIGEYNDWVRVPFKIVPPCFQGTDDGKELSVIDLIILFCEIEGL